MKKKKVIQVLTPDRLQLCVLMGAGSTIKDLKKEVKKYRPEYNRLNFYFNSIRLSTDVLLNDINQPPGWSIIAVVSNKFPEESIYTFMTDDSDIPVKMNIKNNTLIKDVKTLLISHAPDYDGPLFLTIEGFPLPNLIPIGSIGIEESQVIMMTSVDPMPDRMLTYTYQLPHKQISYLAFRANSTVSELIAAFSPYVNLEKERVKFLYHQRELETDCCIGDWGITENDVIYVNVKGARPRIKRKIGFVKPTLGKNAQKFKRHYIPISAKSFSTQDITIHIKRSANAMIGTSQQSSHVASNSISDYLDVLQPYEIYRFQLDEKVFTLPFPIASTMKFILPNFERMMGASVIFEDKELRADKINVFHLTEKFKKIHIFSFAFDYLHFAMAFDAEEVDVQDAVEKISAYYDADPTFIHISRNGIPCSEIDKINEADVLSVEIKRTSVSFVFESETSVISFYRFPKIIEAKKVFCHKKGIALPGLCFREGNSKLNDDDIINTGTTIIVEQVEVYKVNVSINGARTEVLYFEVPPIVQMVKEQLAKNLKMLPASFIVTVFDEELSDDFQLLSYFEILQIHICKYVFTFALEDNETFQLSFDSHPIADDATKSIAKKFSVEYETITLFSGDEMYTFTDSLPSKKTINVKFGPLKFRFDHENGESFIIEFDERPTVRDTIQIISERIKTPPELLLLANDDDILYPWEKIPPRSIISETDLKEGFFHFMVPRQRPFPIVLNEDAPIEVELGKIAERCGTIPSDIKLILNGRVLLPSETLRSLDMSIDDIITVYIKKADATY